MSFVYPGFLFALFALAIPIIIHLFNFRRFKTIYFSNVKFLKNIQEETATRNRLKHVLVLCARLLALAFLIGAFAQPFIRSEIEQPASVIRTAGIYIDNSFSMEAMNDGNQLLAIAKTKAEEIVQGYNIDDRFQLLTNDFEARQQRLVNKEEMLEMIRAVQISPTVRTLEEVIKRQKDILHREKETENTIYIISDFQKNTADFENDSTLRLTLIPLQGNEERNIAIDSVWFTSPIQMLNQPSFLCFTIKNYGTTDIENASVTVKINEQVKGIADVTVAAKSEITDTLQFTVQDAGIQHAALEITDYPITFDDILYFSYQPVQKIPVLCINGKDQNNFITSLYAGNALFSFQQYAVTQVDFNNLSQFNCIILNEMNSLSSGLTDALNKKIEDGATILFIPSFEMDKNNINLFLANNNAASYSEIIPDKRNVSSINTSAEIFRGVFEELPKNLSMPYADKSFSLSAGNRSIEEMIMQFSDNTPMLAKYKAGNGAIYVCAMPFDRTITDFPVQGGLFVPFMYRLAVVSMKDAPLYVTIGKEQWVKIPANNFSNEQTVTVKNKSVEFIPAMRKAGNSVEIDVSNYAKEADIYTVTGNNINQSIALNYNRSESDLSFLDADALREKYSEKNISILDNPARNLSNVVTQMQQGRPLWKYCIIFALLFLATEILIIRFMP
ncbi:MAG: BatA domain-containing protein [Chitinophagales bacterium]|nr:BatA domain-containing protein [Chitinophagales bacterium]